jgi:hypothetical protein
MYAKADSVGGRQIADSMATERHRDTLSTRSIVHDTSLAIRSAMGAYLPLAGGTLTGTVVLTGSGQSFAGGAGYDFLTSAPMSSTIIHIGNGASTAAISFPKVATKSFEVAGSAAFDSSVALTVKSAPFLGTDSAGRIIASSALHDTADTLRAYARARINDSLATERHRDTLSTRSIVHDTSLAIRSAMGAFQPLEDQRLSTTNSPSFTRLSASGVINTSYSSGSNANLVGNWNSGGLYGIGGTGALNDYTILLQGVSVLGIPNGHKASLKVTGSATFDSSVALTVKSAPFLGTDSAGRIIASSALHDTADTLRAYARARINDSLAALTPARIGAEPLWSTANVVPKGNGSTGLVSSSLSDDGNTVGTGEKFQSTFSGTQYFGPFGIIETSAVPGIELKGTSAPLNAKIWDVWSDNSGTFNLSAARDDRSVSQTIISASRNGITPGKVTIVADLESIYGMKSGTDTITSLSAGGVIKANATTGELALAGSGDLPGGPYLPVANPAFAGTLSGPTITAAGQITSTYSGSTAGPFGLVSKTTAPGISLWHTGAATNSKIWGIWGDIGGGLNFDAINDAQNSTISSTYLARNGDLTLQGALQASGSVTSTATGTAISAPNGDISTGGEVILASSQSISGAGVYTQVFQTTNAIQYYDGGGTFTLTAPSASGFAGKSFRICNRAATITGFPTGANAYYTSTGALVSVGHCVDAMSDGTKWFLLP